MIEEEANYIKQVYCTPCMSVSTLSCSPPAAELLTNSGFPLNGTAGRASPETVLALLECRLLVDER